MKSIHCPRNARPGASKTTELLSKTQAHAVDMPGDERDGIHFQCAGKGRLT